MIKPAYNKFSSCLKPAANGGFSKYLIYSKRNVKMYNITAGKTLNVDVHRMADTENGIYAGEMITRPVKNLDWNEIYPEERNCNALKIEQLKIEERRNGYGTAFLKFAETESKARGCDGKVFLVASRIYDPKHPCHIFYRKQGYTSTNEYINRILDRCIQNNTKLDPEYADNLIMYKPTEIKQPRIQKTGLFNKLKRILAKLI